MQRARINVAANYTISVRTYQNATLVNPYIGAFQVMLTVVAATRTLDWVTAL